jgi:hypothetical protein
MTYPDNFTVPEQYLEQLAQEGLEGLPEMIRILINEAMQLERQDGQVRDAAILIASGVSPPRENGRSWASRCP